MVAYLTPTGAFPSAEEPALLSPLVLGFSDGRRRFCPLVTFQGDSCFRDPTTALRIPLVSRSGHVLPVRFITPEEVRRDHGGVPDQLPSLNARASWYLKPYPQRLSFAWSR